MDVKNVRGGWMASVGYLYIQAPRRAAAHPPPSAPLPTLSLGNAINAYCTSLIVKMKRVIEIERHLHPY